MSNDTRDPSAEDDLRDFLLPVEELTRRVNETFIPSFEPRILLTTSQILSVTGSLTGMESWIGALDRALNAYRNFPLTPKDTSMSPLPHTPRLLDLKEESEEDTIPLQDMWEAFPLKHHFVDTPKMPLSDNEKRFLLTRPQGTATLVELAREYALRIARGAALQELGVTDFPCSELRGIVFEIESPHRRRDSWDAEGGFVIDPQGPQESEEHKYDGPMAVQVRPVLGHLKQPRDPDLDLDPELYPPWGVWKEPDPHEGPPPDPGMVNLHSYVNPDSFLEAIKTLSGHWQNGYPGKQGLTDPNSPLLALFKHPFQVRGVRTLHYSIPGAHFLRITVMNPT
jgi:hypothetical protein